MSSLGISTVFVGRFSLIRERERDLWAVQRFRFNPFKKLVFFTVPGSVVSCQGRWLRAAAAVLVWDSALISTQLNRSLRCDTPAGWRCTAAVVHRVLCRGGQHSDQEQGWTMYRQRVLRELTVRACVSPAANKKKQGRFEAESSVWLVLQRGTYKQQCLLACNYSILAFWAESMSMNRVLKGLKDAIFILNLVCKIYIEYYRG